MFKKFVLASSAFTGESFLWGYHSSIAGITDGKADYSHARFYRVFLDMQQGDTIATEGHIHALRKQLLNHQRFNSL